MKHNIQLIKLNIHLGNARTSRVFSTFTLKNLSLIHDGKQFNSMTQEKPK